MVARGVGLFNSSDDEEEFFGFTREDLRGEESNSNASGESDFSLSEASEQESSEESEDENAEDDVWSRNLRNTLVNNFEKDTGPSNILTPEEKADSFLYQMFPEDLIDLIVNETNRNAEQKQRASGRQDKDWTPVDAADIRAYLAIRILQGPRRCGCVYLGVVVLRVRYFEHALLQLKNCHHILPEKLNHTAYTVCPNAQQI